MKLSQLNARAKADAGVEIPLRDHITGKPLIDGDKPLMVIVRGSAAHLDEDAMRASILARKALETMAKDGEAVLTEDMHRITIMQALPYVAGFRNVELDDGSPATEADARAVLDLTKWREPTEAQPGISFAQQVIAAVAEADAALGNG